MWKAPPYIDAELLNNIELVIFKNALSYDSENLKSKKPIPPRSAVLFIN